MDRITFLILALLICTITQLSSNCVSDNSPTEKLNNPSGKILFIRGGPGTGGFLEGGSDEQLADINNYQTFGGNHGWGQFKDILIGEGYTVEQRIEAPNQPISLVASDLANYVCIIFGSNNAPYNTTHANTVFNYISNGGSAMFISDANFGSNWGDAPSSDQPFLDKFGWTMNQDAGQYTKTANEFLVPNHPIFQGVNSFDGEGVSPITVSSTVPGVITTKLARAEGGVRRNNGMNAGPVTNNTANDCALVVATVGNGRVAGHFDRNTFFNTNGAGTDITKDSNTQYAKNLINWLTNAGSCPAAGTPCNDNNPNTYFDQQNGSCSCVGTPAQPIPSRIEAESYYQQTGIQTVNTNDGGGGTKVGFINDGDTTGYVVDVANSGAHTIRLRAASNTTGGTVNVSMNGTQIGSFTVSNTGGFETFQTLTINAALDPGVQVLSLEYTGAANSFLMDVNWIEFLFNCPPQGTVCNDSDDCTTNDVYDNNCNCAGTFEDTDNDSVCDADDVCPNFDDTLIGTPCNDNNPATNNDVYTSNCICEGSIQPAIICLEPIHDAYLQGTGQLFNTAELRVEANNRVGYLMYDLSSIQGTVTGATLEITVGSDAGSGRIMMEKGTTNNWTETTLSNTNKPAAAGLLGELTQGAYTVNSTYTWPLTGVTVGGDFSIIMTHTSGNDVSFKSGENADISDRPTLCLTVTPPTTTQTVECETQLFLEGPFDGQNKMANDLQALALLPNAQPYTGAPWNYAGTETNTTFPTNYIDWVLVSLRTSSLATDEVAKGAVVLLEDGTTATNLSAVLDVSVTSLYVVVEHRNHLPVMSPTLIPIVNGVVSHDFRAANSYTTSGLGQKQIGTNWMLYAGNVDQSLPTGYEITGADNILWRAVNGTSGIYYPEDFNMDGDITGADKVMWSYNNGVFSSLPK